MAENIDQFIVDETAKQISTNNEETPINSIDDIKPKSFIEPWSHFDTNSSLKETNADEIYQPSNPFVQQQQQNTPTTNEGYKYRIHLGTQPGYVKEDEIVFTMSEKLHCKIIHALKSFLSDFKINYKIIRKDCFSNSEWGLEPYACILLSCSDEMVKTVAAIVGLALRQDAIGIFNNHGDGFPHPVYTVSTTDDSLFTKNDALVLMKTIPKHCSCLAAQFDENGKNIELHDFDKPTDDPISIARIQTIIKRYFGTEKTFQVTETIGYSDLLEEKDYQSAIKQTGHESFGKFIELTRLHDGLYGNSEST